MIISARTLFVSVLAAASLFAITASAGAPAPLRQGRQAARTGQGVATGQLTASETARLAAQQTTIQVAKVRARADGIVTGRERARLDHLQDHSSRTIYGLKHNGRSR